MILLPRSLTSQWRRALQLTAIFLCLSAASVWSQEPAPEKPADTIRFCSYNLKNWLSMDRRYNAPKGSTTNLKPKPEKEREMAIAILKQIQPDILGVCEIGGDADLADLKQRLADAGLNYFAHTTQAHGGDPTRKLALLSRYPIVATHHQTNLNYRIGDLVFPVQRGFLDATIQVTPDFQLRCVGVHLKSQREVTDADQEVMRRNETFLLRRHAESILKEDPSTKLLLYGDFNDDPKSIGIEALHGSRADPNTHLTDVQLRDSEGEVWTHFYDWEDSYSRLDYFFVSPALHSHVSFKNSFIYRTRDFNIGSDHRPIVLGLSPAATKKTKKS